MGRASQSLDRRPRRAWWWRVDVPDGVPSLQVTPLQGTSQVCGHALDHSLTSHCLVWQTL